MSVPGRQIKKGDGLALPWIILNLSLLGWTHATFFGNINTYSDDGGLTDQRRLLVTLQPPNDAYLATSGGDEIGAQPTHHSTLPRPCARNDSDSMPRSSSNWPIDDDRKRCGGRTLGRQCQFQYDR